MDTWPLDHANPIELNRYVYAAGNCSPLLPMCPFSGYAFYSRSDFIHRRPAPNIDHTVEHTSEHNVAHTVTAPTLIHATLYL